MLLYTQLQEDQSIILVQNGTRHYMLYEYILDFLSVCLVVMFRAAIDVIHILQSVVKIITILNIVLC